MTADVLLSAVGGGMLRLAPELLKFATNVSEQRHELRMQQVQLEFAKLGTPGSPEQIAPITAADLAMLQERYIQDVTDRTAKRYPWVAMLAALVRPAATYWLLALYSAALLARTHIYGEVDLSLLSGVLAFWFVGRVLKGGTNA